jgi:exosortase A
VSGRIGAIRGERTARFLSGLRDAWLGLAIGLIALGIVFHVEIAAAVKTWITSTAYNHCFLVIPIALYLIWDRRASLRGLIAAPMPVVALLALPIGIVWLAAERLGIMEGRQLAAVSMVEVLFLAMLGRRLWTSVSGPLLYLYLLVPFGEFLTPGLQDITTWFIRHGLNIMGIPAYIDGYVIDIPEGTFFVAEACAGLRFLIASIAFGVLYALLMYRDPMRRALFIVVSVIVPIVANGFRALGIVALGHLLGSTEAAAADHLLYGWLFFSFVILVLIVLGLPFRQDDQPEAASSSPMKPGTHPARHGLITGFAVAVLAALAPAIALGLDHAATAPELALTPLDLSPSCVTTGDGVSSGRTIIQHVTCGGTAMTIEIEVFSPRSTAAAFNAERRRLTRPPEADDMTEAPMTTRAGDKVPGWRVIEASQPAFVAAAGLWIEGEPATPGVAMRLKMARDSFAGGSYSPVLVIIAPVADWPRVDARRKVELERQISDLVAAHPGIGDQIRLTAKVPR